MKLLPGYNVNRLIRGEKNPWSLKCKTQVTLEPGKRAPARPARPVFLPAILTSRAGTPMPGQRPCHPYWGQVGTDIPLTGSKSRRLKNTHGMSRIITTLIRV